MERVFTISRCLLTPQIPFALSNSGAFHHRFPLPPPVNVEIPTQFHHLSENMAEILASVLLRPLFDKLTNLLRDELGLLLAVKKDLEKLRSTFSALQAAIEDAEARPVKDNGLRDWLGKIREVAYYVDDILDDFETEAMRRKVEKVRNFFSPWDPLAAKTEMAHRIQGALGRLDEIAREKSMFNLGEGVAGSKEALEIAERRQTHSFVNECEVRGRQNEREQIVQMLTGMGRDVDISVISIVGIGGLGKTTLAQLVYNDDRVTDYFDLRIWVCVSENFDAVMLAKSIVQSATKKEPDLSQMEPLQFLLRQVLNGKRYLLVLDDVWNEKQAAWERLKTLLRGGKVGSKVLVTTRSKIVSSIMGALALYHLEELSEEDCWTLFKWRAFESGEEEKYPNLVAMGKVIVGKCRGVPLAAKALGGLLRFKRRPNEWSSIKDSEVWQIEGEEEILPALQLSYTHLPSYLKQCFAYCSIFLKGHLFRKDVLIQQWMAQGFLQCKGTALMEDIGAEYFDELCWRSFFQDVKELTYDDDGEYETVVECKMHDLVNDLARSVAGTECSSMIIAKDKTIEAKARYSSFVCDMRSTLINIMPVNEAHKVRALISLPNMLLHYNTNVQFSLETVNLRCLRALDLSGTAVKNLPASIGNLKHLRYLNLSDNGWIERLPSSICSLWNLQTLKLKDCDSLRGLPKDMRKMISLRHLEVDQYFRSWWCEMPPGIGQLRYLQTLPLFIVGVGSGRGIEELRDLMFLGGTLFVRDLQNVVEPKNAEKANLKGKERLQSLKLFWHGNSVNQEQVIENLQPHSNLEVLNIDGYNGVKFPNWLLDSRLPNLIRLSFNACTRCQNLPPLQQLSSLKFLQLAFMDNLENWLDEEKGEELPCVEELVIIGCPRLNSLPWLPSLKKLKILSSNEKLLKSVANYTSLSSLHIGGFREMVSLPDGLLQNHTLPRTLHISYCPNLKSLPKELNSLRAVEELSIRDCENAAASLVEACVNIRRLELSYFSTLTSWPEQNGTHGEAFTSLKVLQIKDCQELRSLHEQWFQCLTALEALMIDSCSNFTYLPHSIKHLTSLHMLQLYDLPKLEFLPNGMENLTSLQLLDIFRCPQLAKQCRRERGKDWHKIRHIPAILIDHSFI